MRSARLVRDRDGAVLIPRVEVLRSLGRRLRGLIGSARLGEGRAVWLIPCSSVHTLGMRFRLDLVFLSRGFEVVRVRRNVGPGRIALGGLRARSVLELEAGWFPVAALGVGERVRIEPLGPTGV